MIAMDVTGFDDAVIVLLFVDCFCSVIGEEGEALAASSVKDDVVSLIIS